MAMPAPVPVLRKKKNQTAAAIKIQTPYFLSVSILNRFRGLFCDHGDCHVVKRGCNVRNVSVGAGFLQSDCRQPVRGYGSSQHGSGVFVLNCRFVFRVGNGGTGKSDCPGDHAEDHVC